jgi:hypothetical protein
MKIRRPPKKTIAPWLLSACLIIVGPLVGYYAGARAVGLTLLVIGVIGFIGGGIIIFVLAPRRD